MNQYLMQQFSVNNNDVDYKTTNHKYKIFFQTTMAIIICDDVKIPEYRIKFFSIQDIISQIYDNTILCGKQFYTLY